MELAQKREMLQEVARRSGHGRFAIQHFELSHLAQVPCGRGFIVQEFIKTHLFQTGWREQLQLGLGLLK